MPSSRCAVQGCSNRSNTKAGISLHISPVVNSERAKWVNFVRIHRANFNPAGRFVVCSDHFGATSFERTFIGVDGVRRLKPGACPSIWKKKQAVSPISARSRRKVSSDLGFCCVSFPRTARRVYSCFGLWQVVKELLQDDLQEHEDNDLPSTTADGSSRVSHSEVNVICYWSNLVVLNLSRPFFSNCATPFRQVSITLPTRVAALVIVSIWMKAWMNLVFFPILIFVSDFLF